MRSLTSDLQLPKQHEPAMLPVKFEKAKEALNQKFDAKVDMKVNAKGNGTITISFKSDDDFDRIVSRLQEG